MIRLRNIALSALARLLAALVRSGGAVRQWS
jgi:hypothetical protein